MHSKPTSGPLAHAIWPATEMPAQTLSLSFFTHTQLLDLLLLQHHIFSRCFFENLIEGPFLSDGKSWRFILGALLFPVLGSRYGSRFVAFTVMLVGENFLRLSKLFYIPIFFYTFETLERYYFPLKQVCGMLGAPILICVSAWTFYWINAFFPHTHHFTQSVNDTLKQKWWGFPQCVEPVPMCTFCANMHTCTAGC